MLLQLRVIIYFLLGFTYFFLLLKSVRDLCLSSKKKSSWVTKSSHASMDDSDIIPNDNITHFPLVAMYLINIFYFRIKALWGQYFTVFKDNIILIFLGNIEKLSSSNRVSGENRMRSLREMFFGLSTCKIGNILCSNNNLSIFKLFFEISR